MNEVTDSNESFGLQTRREESHWKTNSVTVDGIERISKLTTSFSSNDSVYH